MKCYKPNFKVLVIIYTIQVSIGLFFGILIWTSINNYNHEELKRTINADQNTCNSSLECNHGTCELDGPNNYMCECDEGWINKDNKVCSYKQKLQLIAFLLSFFLGTFGADWFYLSVCNPCDCYSCVGVVKLLTVGGAGVWWLVDWIRIIVNTFPDGNNIPLKPW